MADTTSPPCCRFHMWDRRLDVHNHVERVIRVCTRCGLTEVCWVRQWQRSTVRRPYCKQERTSVQ